jgi:predicted nucleic acid-binding protein
MRKVIVNSTPLIALCKVNQLDLLRRLYGEITVPKAVFEEVTKKNDLVRKEVAAASWIHIETVQDTKAKRMYRAKLHDGEVEVMILAQEYEGEHLVVIDDNAARKTAQFLGLTLTGTLGVLIKAKELGLIDSVMPIVGRMEENEIYFSDSLKARVKRLSRE